MPDSNNFPLLTGKLPIATYTATFQINSGTAIAAGATTAAQTITFTGLATTDKEFGISPRDAIVIPTGLQLVRSEITAADTLTVQFKNTTAASITPPASATWTCVVLADFFK